LYKKDLGLGIGTIIMGILLLIYFINIPAEPGFFPKIVCCCTVLVGITITIRTLIQLKSHAQRLAEKPEGKDENISYKSVSLITAYLFVYYFAFQYIGYIIPTFLLIVMTSVTLNFRKWKVLIPTALSVSVCLYVLFSAIFNIRFPGIFF